MRLLSRALAAFTTRTGAPFVMRSQLRALAVQVPLLYATLCVNALALAYTHLATAPRLLTLAVPAMLMPICAIRVLAWRRLDVDALSDAGVAAQLRRTMALVVVLGASFTAWSLALFSYGDAYAKAHVAFFMSITVVGCIFCMIHLRPAALALTAIVVVPFTARFLLSGEIVLAAIAINFVIVAAVMTFMLLAYDEDFRRLVQSREELARIGEENRRAAQTDSLTGLANRRRFFEDLDVAFAAHDASGAVFALGLVDLDGFKPVNDLLGHQAGDQVLVEVARRLMAAVGPHATIARLGGDEFGLIVPAIAGDTAIQALGDHICAIIAHSYELADASMKIAASAGFAMCADTNRSGEWLFERADFALYHAKERCRGRAVLFNHDHARQIADRRAVETALRQADLECELHVVFQPVVDIGASTILGFEALARWTSPTLGDMSPAIFIPAAERLGIVQNLTAVVFAKACRVAKTWPAAVRLSVNLSVKDLVTSGAGARLTAMVLTCGLAPGRITFEVTEAAIMQDFDCARATLQALRTLGCQTALDDFGTGYSSLSYVHRLPIDEIKIDQRFVRSLSSEAASRTIIRSIIGLSASLGLACIVEGVESSEQFDLLRAIGGTAMQGYLFGRPMSPEAAAARLHSQELIRPRRVSAEPAATRPVVFRLADHRPAADVSAASEPLAACSFARATRRPEVEWQDTGPQPLVRSF